MQVDQSIMAALRDRPAPIDLAALDDAIILGVRERQQVGSLSRTAAGACAAMALIVGVAGGSLGFGAASTIEPQLALSATPLAPSQLLGNI